MWSQAEALNRYVGVESRQGMLRLTDNEKAMLDGRDGKARQKAMELLVRYAEALGAERFVDTRNVAGVPGSANPFLQRYYAGKDVGGRDAIFSFFDLDSDELIDDIAASGAAVRKISKSRRSLSARPNKLPSKKSWLSYVPAVTPPSDEGLKVNTSSSAIAKPLSVKSPCDEK